MDNLNKLLIAIDFSEYAEPTLRYGLALAGDLGADVVVLNVINQRDLEAVRHAKQIALHIDEEQYIRDQTAERLERMERMVAESGCVQVKTEKMIRLGVPAAEILKAIGDTGAQMVVVGTKGRTNLTGLLFGSVAEKVYRRSPVTVVSVRGKEHADLVCRMNS